LIPFDTRRHSCGAGKDRERVAKLDEIVEVFLSSWISKALLISYHLSISLMETDSQFGPSVSAHASSPIPVEGERVAIPRPEDVVATKIRTWHGHDGNIFYRDLVEKASCNIERSDNEGTRRAAERIVNIITLDRKGVFLRKESDGWVVMGHRSAVNKVSNAIKNVQDKVKAGSWAAKQQKRYTCTKKTPKARQSDPAKKRSSSPNSIVYQAQSGATTTIHEYALQVISAACNSSTPQEALLFLESPMPQYRNGNERSRERMMRLQVRAKRFHS
jgi:hypothetical protein